MTTQKALEKLSTHTDICRERVKFLQKNMKQLKLHCDDEKRKLSRLYRAMKIVREGNIIPSWIEILFLSE